MIHQFASNVATFLEILVLAVLLDLPEIPVSVAHIHILSRPGRYLGGNLATTRKFLASERKFFGQQLTVAASKSSLTTLGIKVSRVNFFSR